MAKPDTVFVCQSCGAIHPKWMGKCEACGSWNTLAEEGVRTAPGAMAVPMGQKPKGAGFVDLLAEQPPEQRLSTGISEFDRVCGGGLVAASGLLIGGDPGVGKSTLLLQAAAGVAKSGANVAYVSGEEAEAQIQE